VYQPYGFQYAGFWWRLLAYAIDAVISLCIFVPLGAIVGVMIAASGEDAQSPSMLIARFGINVVSILVTWLYYAFCESSAWQGTVGKKLIGLRVTDTAGQRIGFGQATGRHFGKMLSGLILGFGFIMIAFTEQKQGLHDQMAGTLVLMGEAQLDYPLPPDPPDFSYRGGPLNIG
jgi:uncharacterized RDD family membrane protein YckC